MYGHFQHDAFAVNVSAFPVDNLLLNCHSRSQSPLPAWKVTPQKLPSQVRRSSAARNLHDAGAFYKLMNGCESTRQVSTKRTFASCLVSLRGSMACLPAVTDRGSAEQNSGASDKLHPTDRITCRCQGGGSSIECHSQHAFLLQCGLAGQLNRTQTRSSTGAHSWCYVGE